MFGRRKKTADQNDGVGGHDELGTDVGVDTSDDTLVDSDLEPVGDDGAEPAPDLGPFDLTELDEDRESLAASRLDLGSVLVPLPAGGQLQVEMSKAGAPQAVHVVTQHGRITVAAYAAPKSPGQWREVAGDLATSLRNDKSEVSVETGPWGRELHAVTANADLRFIGVDGYRWMVRCVLAGPSGAVSKDSPLVAVARDMLSQTVVDRGLDPHPVRTPLPVVLPEALVAQLAAAQQKQAEQAAAQQAAARQAAAQPQPSPGQQAPAGPPEEPRRGSSGSAMQQLGN